ncbi:MAG TPA: hypothetical protein VF472_12335 [Burkholderiaceae bacterium]
MSAYDLAGADDTGEPNADIPQVAEEMNAIVADRLQLLGATLAKRRDEWVAARRNSRVEQRWLLDLDQYNGRDDASREAASMMDSVEAGFPVTNREARPQRSRVFVNITRPKSNAAEARLANMVLPSDDRNWGFKPTPDSVLTAAALQQARQNAAQVQQTQQAQQPQQAQPPQQAQQQAKPQQQAQPGAPAQSPGAPSGLAQAVLGTYPSADLTAQLDMASRCAQAMEDEIEDLMIQCDFNGEERKMLHDCTVLGTGILKGPIVVNRMRKAYRKIPGTTVWELQMEEEKTPASERVDPWDVFPDPGCGEDVHAGIGIFEKKQQTARQLRELTKQPGYLKEQISHVLEEGPLEAEAVSQRDIGKDRRGSRTNTNSDHFQLWEYWGEFTPEDLRACGVNVPDGATESISGCVILVNSTVIKGFLNPIETGDIPYDFMVWEKVDGECWGYGMPYLMRSPQKVLNAAWRQLMDNAGLSVGPQIVIDPSGIEPADNQWMVQGRKIWLKKDPAIDIRNVFATFEVESYAAELQSIIKLAQDFADNESSTPQLAQGERGTAPDTVGGMTLLMNSSNVVLGRMVKQFDDMITRPHLRRYYDWYMAYGAKDECKGDFQVDARGTSVLLVRDVASQALLNVAQYSANPEIAKLIDWTEYFKAILKTQHIDPTDIMKTDAEIAQDAAQQAPPSDAQVRAQAQLQAAQIAAAAQQQVAAAAAARAQQIEASKSQREQAAVQAKNQGEAMRLAMVQDHEARENQRDRMHDSLLAAHDAMSAHLENSADRVAGQLPRQGAQVPLQGQVS